MLPHIRPSLLLLPLHIVLDDIHLDGVVGFVTLYNFFPVFSK